MTTNSPGRVARAFAQVMVAFGLLSTCDSGSAADPAPPTGPAVTSTPLADDPIERQTMADVLTVYEKYRQAYVTAAQTSDYHNRELARYTADPLLSQLRQDLRQRHRQGLVTVGRPVWRAQVTRVQVTVRPFTAVIEDCFDATGWNTVDRASGEAAAVPGQAKKYLVTAEAAQYDAGRWLIRASVADRDRSC